MSRIGLLSDSHGHGPITRRAVDLLLERGAEVLLYLGDVCGESVIDALAVAPPAQSRLVFGNCDYDLAALTAYAEGLGIAVDHPVGRLDTPRGPLIYSHGHDSQVLPRAIEEGAAYFCHGHTHHQADDRIGPTRVINPGALHRASAYTVALLDSENDELAFYPIGRA